MGSAARSGVLPPKRQVVLGSPHRAVGRTQYGHRPFALATAWKRCIRTSRPHVYRHMDKVAYWIGLAGAAWAMAWGPTELLAGSCRLESADHRVTVLELYTSEGCNSCPPADRWLSGLPARGISADRAVLLAFHVDYWNQLGWPDRFSKPAYSARQREVAQRASSGVVYTPQVVLDGRALRQTYSFETLETRLNAISREKGQASISADVTTAAGQVRVSGEVRLAAIDVRQDVEVWIALFEQGLSSRVTRGENGEGCCTTTSWCASWPGRFRSVPMGAAKSSTPSRCAQNGVHRAPAWQSSCSAGPTAARCRRPPATRSAGLDLFQRGKSCLLRGQRGFPGVSWLAARAMAQGPALPPKTREGAHTAGAYCSRFSVLPRSGGISAVLELVVQRAARYLQRRRCGGDVACPDRARRCD